MDVNKFKEHIKDLKNKHKDPSENINKIVYRDNHFRLEKMDYRNVKVFVNLNKYNKTKSAYTAYFSYYYRELLIEYLNALNMPYLFSFIPYKDSIDNVVFLDYRTTRIDDKELIIKQSAYLQHIIKTMEEEDYLRESSLSPIFDYDDLSTIEIIVNTTITYYLKNYSDNEDDRLKSYLKRLKKILKLKIKNHHISNKTVSNQELPKEEIVKSKITNSEKYYTRKEVAELLSISLPTLSKWTKEKKIISVGLGGRVFYKKSDIDNALIELK